MSEILFFDFKVSAPGYETKVLAVTVHNNAMTRTNITLYTQNEAYEKIKHGDSFTTRPSMDAPQQLIHGIPRAAYIMLVSKYCFLYSWSLD